MAVGLAKSCGDVCESAAQTSRSYSWVWRPDETEEFASVCEDNWETRESWSQLLGRANV